MTIMVMYMDIQDRNVGKQYSIPETRHRLPGIIHEVEQGSPVEVTRRGRPVAVILSLEEYRRLSEGRPSFGELFDQFRISVDLAALNFTAADFEGLRDRSPGRDLQW
jgi:antitoxin Phd